MYQSTWTATGCVAVTKSDTARLEPAARALWVNGAGDIAVEFEDGSTGTFTVEAGEVPFQAVRVLSTGTTATGIYALY